MTEPIDEELNRMLELDANARSTRSDRPSLSEEDGKLLVEWVLFTMTTNTAGERMAALNRRLLSRVPPTLKTEDLADVKAICKVLRVALEEIDKAAELLERKAR